MASVCGARQNQCMCYSYCTSKHGS
jgi:hypothetical protein